MSTSLQEIPRQKQSKSKNQATINKQRLLTRSQSIPSEPKLLVLREPRDLHTLTLEEALRRSAGRTSPIFWKLREGQSGRYRVRGVADGLFVFIPAGLAFEDSGVYDCELLLEAAGVDVEPFLFLNWRFLFLVGFLFLLGEGLVVLRDVDGVGEDDDVALVEGDGLVFGEGEIGFGGSGVGGGFVEVEEGEYGFCCCC